MRLTDDQRAFRDDLRAYLADEIDPIVDERDRNGPMARDELVGYLDELADLGIGFTPDTVDRYFGDVWRFAIASEEISRVWPSLNVALQMSFPSLFVRFASEETRRALLPKLEDNRCIGCLAVTEPDGGSDTAHPNTVARRDGDEFVLDGEKVWVGNAGIADVALVVARDESADARDLFLVDRENAAYETEPMSTLGWKGVPNGRLVLDDVRIPVGNRFSTIFSEAIAEGYDVHEIVPFPEGVSQLFLEHTPLNVTFSFMRTGMAFMAVGIMRAAFEDALEYARDRETFGEPIGKHQLVQEKLYDVRAAIEASRGLARSAAEALVDGDPDARLLSSLAKGYACERSIEATGDALQVLGAAGLDLENRMERYYRDARVMTIPDGTTEIQKLIVGKELTGLSAY
ncbi:acyl-CoA dehydrogenase family protein [Natrinema salsiterrestre]|uniref:Acyl-CoA/acyl-ACP dehydrogenase n=1 Tax=Natrinema salsiterrestre TaxID=2950540 RepID=A0A9Q4PZ80_9EURY|nr:acyl-CoA dehydrogenase family protein [Natrinema salsiterrestre]MDF9744375.1 acyl-CoA/acyl-ACP dehydrogenase [Natrinema salsiterrestre]